jgi:hypothetical protein
MPASRAARGNPSPEQIEAWAAGGLTRLGAVQVWRLSWRTGNGTGPEHKAIWPSARRESAAYHMAWRYLCAREAQGHAWPRPERVSVEYTIDCFTTFTVEHDRRDLEYAQRYGWPTSILVDGDAQASREDL